MPFILRFVQRYRAADRDRFMELEAKFVALEKKRDAFPKGRRCQPYSGREPGNTLIWECEFPSLEDAQAALAKMEGDPEHDELFAQQVPFFKDAWTEIYEVLEF